MDANLVAPLRTPKVILLPTMDLSARLIIILSMEVFRTVPDAGKGVEEVTSRTSPYWYN